MRTALLRSVLLRPLLLVEAGRHRRAIHAGQPGVRAAGGRHASFEEQLAQLDDLKARGITEDEYATICASAWWKA
jgi:hypothetical protein